MSVVEFVAEVDDGKIEIPIEYRNKLDSKVRVVLFNEEAQKTRIRPKEERELRAFGALANYANPDLWHLEEGAMERAVVENYVAKKRQYEIDRHKHSPEISTE